MSTPDPTVPVPRQDPAGSEPTTRIPQHRLDAASNEADGPEDTAPDAYGLPEPPGRGEQHAYEPSEDRGTADEGVAGDASGEPGATAVLPQQPLDEPEETPEADEEPEAPDAFGLPEPPDRGAQHAFDAPPAVPRAPGDTAAAPVPSAFAAPSGYAAGGGQAASGQPGPGQSPTPGYPAAPAQPRSSEGTPPPPPGQAPPYVGGHPSPTPFPSVAPYPSQPPGAYPAGYPAGYPGGGYPPSGGNPTPTAAYPGPYGYAAVDPLAKSRTVAGILGIVLGGLGVHRFYLGYVGIGLVQIAVTVLTFGVGWLWGFIEGILYLTQRTGTYSVDATGRPLRD
jgi:TM2 domain-containing membrane protein YozV